MSRFDTIRFSTYRLNYRFEADREIWIDDRGWVRARDIQPGDRIRNSNGTFGTILQVQVTPSTTVVSGVGLEILDRNLGRTRWERLAEAD